MSNLRFWNEEKVWQMEDEDTEFFGQLVTILIVPINIYKVYDT